MEYERAGFASIIAAIVGGTLTFIATSGIQEVYPIYFLIAFTVVGLLLTIRWTYAFEFHRTQIKEVASALGIRAQVKVDIPAKHVWKIVRARYLFPFFYVITLIGLITFLFYFNEFAVTK